MGRIDKIKKTIKCPLFNYALLDTENGEVIIKRKSFCLFWKTFGKRVVAVKVSKFKKGNNE